MSSLFVNHKRFYNAALAECPNDLLDDEAFGAALAAAAALATPAHLAPPAASAAAVAPPPPRPCALAYRAEHVYEDETIGEALRRVAEPPLAHGWDGLPAPTMEWRALQAVKMGEAAG